MRMRINAARHDEPSASVYHCGFAAYLIYDFPVFYGDIGLITLYSIRRIKNRTVLYNKFHFVGPSVLLLVLVLFHGAPDQAGVWVHSSFSCYVVRRPACM